MNVRKINGDIAEKKAQAFLEGNGFKIIDTDNGQCLPYDIYAEKDGNKYHINVKFAKAKGGLFGIQTSNARLLYSWAKTFGSIPVYLFVFDVNFMWFEFNDSFSKVSKNAVFWGNPNRRDFIEDNLPLVSEAEKLMQDLQKDPNNRKHKDDVRIFLKKMKDAE